MAPEDIRPGVEIIVPAGADATRTLPYRLRVDKVLVSSLPGRVLVAGELTRLSGAPSAKKRNRRVATLDPAKVRLAEED